MAKYPVDLSQLNESEISILYNIFKDIGARNSFRLNQEAEDLFILKIKEISYEVAKHVINEERKIRKL